MEVVLHLGAHRCATTSFQDYVQRNATEFARQGIAFWGPDWTRKTELNALKSLTPVAKERLQRNLQDYHDNGAKQLLVSEENFLGRMAQNLRQSKLYPDAWERAQVLASVFNGWVSKVVLNIRSLDMYWASVAAYMIRRGNSPVAPAHWKRIAGGERSWRHVITDLANGFPGIPVIVLPFEEFAGCPDAQMSAVTQCIAPQLHRDVWTNRDKNPRPQGLSQAQTLQLWSTYADDLTWLASGADGYADLKSLKRSNAGTETSVAIRIDERNLNDRHE